MAFPFVVQVYVDCFRIIHCAITVLVQWYYMRDLEKLIGWARMAIVYMGAGIGGSLASAIFLPYRVSS